MRRSKKAFAAVCAAITAALLNIRAFAAEQTSGGGGRLEGSTAITGTKNMLNDISNALLIIAPIVGVVCVTYFAIRHGAADEMDQKKWKQRIIVAVVSVIVAVLASALISTLVGYYQ